MFDADPHLDAGGEAVLFDVPRVAVKPKPRPRAKAAPRPKPAPPPPPPVLPEPEPHYPVLEGMEEVGSGLLDRFDAMQRVAASAPGGQLLIVAGPGTGKTLVLTTRIAYLVRELDVPAAECLAVVADDRAAEELSERLTALLGEAAADVTVTTYQGLGPLLWGYADQPGRTDPGALATLLDAEPVLTDRLHARWPWVFADDYQDVTEPAYRLLRWLCPPEGNLSLAADPDQAVHTDARYALRFAEDYPDGRTARLSRGYRCSAPILAAALQAVAPTSLVRRRFLDPARRDEHPDPIGRYAATGPAGEADFVARTAGALVASGLAATDIAVLHRDAEPLAAVAAALARAGVPGVRLLTLDAARGQEFPVVFLTGCADGVLPRSSTETDTDARERRLLFVGLTRARQRLYLCYQRRQSRFLDVVDPRLCESLNADIPTVTAVDHQLRLL